MVYQDSQISDLLVLPHITDIYGLLKQFRTSALLLLPHITEICGLINESVHNVGFTAATTYNGAEWSKRDVI